MDTTRRPKQAKPKGPLSEVQAALGIGADIPLNPVEELKKNVKGALRVASEVPENLYNFAKDPSGYTKQLLAQETPEGLGSKITGAYSPGHMGFAGTLSPAQRAANLQAMQAKSAAPGDWFHGTSRDITQFTPKQAGAVFLTRDPKFAEGFADYSRDWMAKHAKDILTPEQLAEAKPKAIAAVKEAYLDTMPEHQEILINAIKKHDPYYESPSSKYFSAEAMDFLHQAYADKLPSAPNIMKLHTAVENPWDFQNPEHLDAVARELNKKTDSWGQPLGDKMKPWLRSGAWPEVEKPVVQDAIKALGHDSFYTKEGGAKNLGVYDPAKIKSATGNEGTYDLTNPDINKKDGGSVKLSRYSKHHRALQR